MSVFALNPVLTDPKVNVGEIVLIEGIPRNRGAFPQFFFMTKTEKGFKLFTNAVFSSEEKATEWVKA